MLKSLFKKNNPIVRTLPAGVRAYAVGDVHGRLDCLDALLAAIDADDAARGPAETHLVLIGDLIDRGPNSRGVVDRAMELVRERPHTQVLLGNHEELLLRSAKGEKQALGVFDKAGGRETLISYGVDPDVYDHATLAEVAALILNHVPAAHRDFLGGLEDQVRLGDYSFVHAGVRPGVPLEHQKTTDLRWIREPFLSHKGYHGAVVVHGHTIIDQPISLPNRIGIDTGAFRSGVLTAVGLEGVSRWFLDVQLGGSADGSPSGR
ncbi:MAG TPA: metallophosphoesterase [Sphingomicrobium sp.]